MESQKLIQFIDNVVRILKNESTLIYHQNEFQCNEYVHFIDNNLFIGMYMFTQKSLVYQELENIKEINNLKRFFSRKLAFTKKEIDDNCTCGFHPM